MTVLAHLAVAAAERRRAVESIMVAVHRNDDGDRDDVETRRDATRWISRAENARGRTRAHSSIIAESNHKNGDRKSGRKQRQQNTRIEVTLDVLIALIV
jgi:hypothetical protein